MSLADVAASLPTARVEEIFHPDEVVVIHDDDGVTHLLLYTWQLASSQYLLLKHVILGPEHAAMFAHPAPVPKTQPPAAAQAELFPTDPEHLLAIMRAQASPVEDDVRVALVH